MRNKASIPAGGGLNKNISTGLTGFKKDQQDKNNFYKLFDKDVDGTPVK
ncbi:MAG: hypothetical protein KBA08_12355 [Firmicutes bacterium]|nr:hypothetical protein [Bacillota bacterium]